LASAAIAAAIALGGCDPESITPTGRSQAPIPDKLIADMTAKNMDKESPILARIFKEESEMELWKQNRNGEFALLKTYPICRWSGDLGPKKKQGDRQAPEGFYTITPGQMNPASNYYLAFNTGFPNTYDRAMGYSGSELMVHGDCSSRGCYAMTDTQIQEIYALARESFFGGQKAFQLQAFPFRMTALNMAKHRNNPNFAFWKMLKEGYDNFNATRQEPRVAVCDRHYVFDAAPLDDSTRALSFNAKGTCPAYQLDKNVADAVLDHRREEQRKMAQYIANDVSTVPSRAGVDGGMNEVFLAKLTTPNLFDNNGRFQLANNAVPQGGFTAPGALPRKPNQPSATVQPPVARPQPSVSEPTAVASVPTPRSAPQAKEAEAPAEKPTTIASLIGGLFGSSIPETAPSAPAKEQVASRSAQKHAAPVRAASAVPSAPVRTASAVAPQAPKARDADPDRTPVSTASSQSAKAELPRTQQPQPEIRTANSTPLMSNNSLLSGAQPVVPTGSFGSFR
jgi:murein L,D-transpeptidase YafK